MRSPAMIEGLESRELFSRALAPSAVEGNYKGQAVPKDGSAPIQFRLIITATYTELIFAGFKAKNALTSKQFLAIREGTYNETFKNGGNTAVLTGSVTKAGMRISGPGKLNSAPGTFAAVKYST